jgi:hypothetical protein
MYMYCNVKYFSKVNFNIYFLWIVSPLSVLYFKDKVHHYFALLTLVLTHYTGKGSCSPRLAWESRAGDQAICNSYKL